MNNTDEININSEHSTNITNRNLYDQFSTFTQKGDQMIAFAAGGSFAGGLIAQIPGAAIGALSGVVFGLFYKNQKSNKSEKNDDRYNLS